MVMEKFGEFFKNKRNERNLSLKEVENATSIRKSYLEAIEEGNVSRLISPIYAHGFVKQYATFLGEDGDEIIRKFPEIFQKKESQEFDYGIGTLEMRGEPGSHVKWFPNLLGALAILAILITAWYLARFVELL